MTEKNHLSSGALPRPSGGAGGGAVVKGLVDKIKQKITYPPLPAQRVALDAPGVFLQALTVHTWRLFFLVVFGMVAVAFVYGPYAVYYFAGSLDAWYIFISFAISYGISVSIHWIIIFRLVKKYKCTPNLSQYVESSLFGFYFQYPLYWSMCHLSLGAALFSLGPGIERYIYQIAWDVYAVLAVLTAALVSLKWRKYPDLDEQSEELRFIRRRICLSSAMVYLFAPGFVFAFFVFLVNFINRS